MDDTTEIVTFTSKYDEYRYSVKACLTLWMISAVVFLFVSGYKYVMQNSGKEMPRWVDRTEKLFNESLILLGIVLLSVLTFASYLFTAIAASLAFFIIIIMSLKASIFNETSRGPATVLVPLVFILALYVNYWIDDHLVA